MILDIRVGGVSLELFPNEEDNFYITKQLHDLRDLKTRNASFTKQIGVPNVQNNSNILRQYLPEFSRFNPNAITFLNVDILIDDIPVIEDAFLFSADYNRTKSEISIIILGGEQEFFNQITNDPISDLFDEVIDWNVANLLANANNSTFWVYPNLSWFDNNSFDLFTAVNTKAYDQFVGVNDIELSGIVVYVKEIWQRIMAQLKGLTADESWFNSYFNELGLASPVYQFLEGYNKIEGVSASVEAAPGTPPSTVEVVKFGTVISDPTGLWNATPDFEFIVLVTGLGKIFIEMDVAVHPQANSDKDANLIFLQKNGTTIHTFIMDYSSDEIIDNHIQYEVITNLVAGDVIKLIADTATQTFGSIKFDYTNELFQLRFGQSDTEVLISDVIPEIGQKDFVKSILQQLHLIPVTEQKVVNFEFWENIINQSPELLVNKIGSNKDIKESNRFKGYGQNNFFKYKEDSNVLRTDMNDSIPSLNKTLPLNVEKIKLIYSGSDDTSIPTLTAASLFGKASIPAFKFEYLEITSNNISVTNGSSGFTTVRDSGLENGDVIVIDDVTVQRMRVELMTSNTSGNFKFNWAGTSGDFSWQHFAYETNKVNNHILMMEQLENIQVVEGDGTSPAAALAKSGLFKDEQLWVNLINTYYPNFAKSIEKPWIIQLFIYLTVKEFITLNSLTPIWISELGEYFYLNKLEQFKKNQLTRIELFRLYTEPI